jgi:hypothetical protein
MTANWTATGMWTADHGGFTCDVCGKHYGKGTTMIFRTMVEGAGPQGDDGLMRTCIVHRTAEPPVGVRIRTDAAKAVFG